MICPSCGFVNEDGVLFCDRCKADLPTPASTPQAPPPMTDPEPIALEPIALEPIDFTPRRAPEPELAPLHLDFVDGPDSAPPITLEPVHPADERKTAGPSLESTDDHPAVGGPAPVAPTPVPAGSPKLVVQRGQRMDVVYPIYPGKNYLGRTDDKPVDIDLEDQEASDRIWTSRQHAVINAEGATLTIEDLNSLNGTFVNRTRVHPGQVKELRENDVIQVGTVHMKVVLG